MSDPPIKTPPGLGLQESQELASAVCSSADYLSALVERFGDVSRYVNSYGPVYFFNHPDHVQSILLNQKYERARLVKLVLGDGLLSSDGDYWRSQRRLISPQFHEHCMPHFVPMIVDATNATFERWHQSGRIDVSFEMRRLTLDVIVRAMFSLSIGDKLDELSDAVTVLIEDLGTLGGSLFNLQEQITPERNARFQRALKCVDNFAHELLASRRVKSQQNRDLVSLLLNAKDESTGMPLNEKQLRDEIVTMLLAGHETTAITLAWAIDLLARNAAARERLRTEVDHAISGRSPQYDDLNSLNYARMVIDETLRLNPPVWFMMRKAEVDSELGGYFIPANTSVLISPYTTHRHKEFWKDPDSFDPERFSQEQSKTRHRYAYVPFSTGRHHCLGHAFAMMETQFILAMIAQHWQLTPMSDRIEPNPAITYRQRGELMVKAIPRYQL